MHHEEQRYGYRWSGLNLISELELPELPTIELPRSATPELRIYFRRARDVQERTALQVQSWMEARSRSIEFQLSGVASYQVTRTRIDVIAHPDAELATVRALLLGTAFGAMAHLRQLLPLHASAALTSEGAVLFLGPAACGKSTLALHLAAQGLPILADDQTVLQFDRHGASIWPNPVPYASQRPSEATVFMPGGVHSPSRAGEVEYRPYRVTQIFALSRTDDAHAKLIVPASGADAIAVLAENCYRPQIAWDLGRRDFVFRRCARLTEYVEIAHLQLPNRISEMQRVARELAERWRVPSVGERLPRPRVNPTPPARQELPRAS